MTDIKAAVEAARKYMADHPHACDTSADFARAVLAMAPVVEAAEAWADSVYDPNVPADANGEYMNRIGDAIDTLRGAR